MCFQHLHDNSTGYKPVSPRIATNSALPVQEASVSSVALWGTTIHSQVFFVVCCLLGLGIFLLGMFSVVYHRFWYERIRKPSFDPSYHPRCSIIIPCKGRMNGLDRVVQAYLDMDYQDFEVIFTVESEEDPAADIVRDVIHGNPKASMVIAGFSKNCCQKNWNMLKAIEKAENPDVYVFADADIVPVKNWLRELVLPLSEKKVAATTGFRWLRVSENPSLGEYTQMYFNGFLYQLFSAASFVGNVGLWGGSMAIRRDDFEKMEVGRRWAETAVDDLSLAELIMKNSKSSVLVPTCVTDDDDALRELSPSMRWIERQMMFLKMYHTHLWVPAIPATLAAIVAIIWFPVSVVFSKGSIEQFLQMGGGGATILVLAGMLSTLWYPLLGKSRHFLSFVMMEPILRVIQLYSLAHTVTTNTICWSGVKYRVKVSSGKVVALQRSGC